MVAGQVDGEIVLPLHPSGGVVHVDDDEVPAVVIGDEVVSVGVEFDGAEVDCRASEIGATGVGVDEQARLGLEGLVAGVSVVDVDADALPRQDVEPVGVIGSLRLAVGAAVAGLLALPGQAGATILFNSADSAATTVHFTTAERLLAGDTDGLNDAYSARSPPMVSTVFLTSPP